MDGQTHESCSRCRELEARVAELERVAKGQAKRIEQLGEQLQQAERAAGRGSGAWLERQIGEAGGLESAAAEV